MGWTPSYILLVMSARAGLRLCIPTDTVSTSNAKEPIRKATRPTVGMSSLRGIVLLFIHATAPTPAIVIVVEPLKFIAEKPCIVATE
jgi:hypothetical protein